MDEDDDEDMDGELRPAMRRFSFNVASRRSSVASAISMPSSRFQVSPPHLSRRYVSSSPEPSSPSEPYIKEETVWKEKQIKSYIRNKIRAEKKINIVNKQKKPKA